MKKQTVQTEPENKIKVCEICRKEYVYSGYYQDKKTRKWERDERWGDAFYCPECAEIEHAKLKKEINERNYAAWKHLARNNPNEMPGGINHKPSWLTYQQRWEEEQLLINFGVLK